MHVNRADLGVHTSEEALCLAQRIRKDHAGTAFGLVALPPLVDVGKHCLLVRPTVDGQAKGGLGNKCVARDNLKRRTGGVGAVLLWSPEHNPHLTTGLQSHLCGPQNVARGIH